MYQQGAVLAYKLGEVSEGFEVGLLGAVYVEVVGVGGCDHGDVRAQLMERAVVFVGFDYRVGRCGREYQIAVVAQQYSAQKCVATHTVECSICAAIDEVVVLP